MEFGMTPESTAWHADLKYWIEGWGYSPLTTKLFYILFVVVLTVAASMILYFVLKFLLSSIAKLVVRHQKKEFTDALKHNKVIKRIGYYIPLIVANYGLAILFFGSPDTVDIIHRVFRALITILSAVVLMSALNTFVELSQYKVQNRSKPIKGMVQFVQIILGFFVIIICISVLFSKTPGALIGGLSAASAVLMLIFKDSITGLIAGIQLSFNDMVRIGDWIAMTKYDVDGEVIDITITSVKVQNWDKSISTVPAYNLIVSDSVKNWRGMEESRARRIARSVNIDMHSVQFCTPEMLERFSRIQYVSDYVQQTEQEIEQYNVEASVDSSILVNGRRQTNLGVFRTYMLSYLKNKNEINKNTSTMVRQLHPTENGIPVQIYCFTDTTVWAEYENIQSDIFDHMLAVLPFFDLKIFQAPNGDDFKTALRMADSE